ncbi:MAG TPA: DNA polymerase Y family protein [Thermoanaerobaculia bacterium]|nr:DNA polymerase Y family protein [Thermoanaerobaculia bacterium]
MPWIACLTVPLFPLAARLRTEPELADEAAAVCAGNGNAARVVAATRRARRAGVRPGQSLPQARALVPRLVTRPRDPQCEASAREALLEAAGTLSPRVEDGGEGVVYVDAEGLERHFGAGDAWQAALGRALIEAAERASLPARAGVAGSKLAARLAASRPGSPTPGCPTVVPAGREAEFLAPLPLERLAPQASVASTLARWGIASVGELARLPEAEVASRLGRAGQELHAMARGLDPHPLVPHHPPPVFREGMILEWPLVNLEPFLFVGRAALERLTARMAGQGLACTRLELALHLEPDGIDERAVDLPAPTRDVKTLLTLLRLDLEARAPGAPVSAFTLVAHPDRPREAQLTLFGPSALSPDRLATSLARLFALLGPDRVGSPRAVDGHRPESFALVPFDPPPPPEVTPAPRARSGEGAGTDGAADGSAGGTGDATAGGTRRDGRGLLAVRVLRPAVELEVLVDETHPRSLAPVLREETAGRPQVQGRVRVASGPWTLEDEWWSEAPVARDYWDVELATGGIYRIYRDRTTGDWFADGVYD